MQPANLGNEGRIRRPHLKEESSILRFLGNSYTLAARQVIVTHACQLLGNRSSPDDSITATTTTVSTTGCTRVVEAADTTFLGATSARYWTNVFPLAEMLRCC